MSEILVEVVERDTTPGQELGPVSVVFASFSERADEVAKTLSDVANKIRAGLDTATGAVANGWHVDAVEVKFSLDLEAEAGVIITRAKTSAGFEATITWKKAG